LGLRFRDLNSMTSLLDIGMTRSYTAMES